MASNEARINLAREAFQKGQFRSIRQAALAFKVSHTTLLRRISGVASRRDCISNSQKLTTLEEQVVVQYILNLDSRGYSPRVSAVAEMANRLLASRASHGSEQEPQVVGHNWPTTFIKRQPELKARFSRRYNYKRALCEDPAIIQGWFDLVRNTITKYGIVNDDIYNFDETGFSMGMISTAMVVTATERRNRPRTLQPGNREWVTVIQGVNATGWVIPPYIIVKGKELLEAWFQEPLPRDWVINRSENGWTTNIIGVDWLKHFNYHTRPRTVGSKRLLILDGHESHNSIEFNDYCKENDIITLCMPAHSSHILQPLDVSCFGPLKRAYGRQIEALIRSQINHISKLEFFPAFKAAFQNAFTRQNIVSGFIATGLVPLDPEIVLLKLEIKLRTPTPPIIDEATWDPKTPSNAKELTLQSTVVKDRIARHQDSSPTEITTMLNQFIKGAHQIAHSLVLLQAENTDLRKANQAANERRKRSKKRINKEGSLTIQAGQDYLDQEAISSQFRQEMRRVAGLGGSRRRGERRCRACGEIGHNSRTCQSSSQLP